MTLGPRRRKAPCTGELGAVEERGKRVNPPAPQKSPGCQISPGKGSKAAGMKLCVQLPRDPELGPEPPTLGKTTLIPSRCLRGWKRPGLVQSGRRS